MAARIEAQAPAHRSLRPYVWALAVAAFLTAALLIWNVGSGSSTATKAHDTVPITKTVNAPAAKTIEARYRALAGFRGAGTTTERDGTTGTVATSPQQR